MTIRKTRYVVASNADEAWLRFRGGLYTSEREDSIVRAEEKHADDHCEPPCKFTVYQVHIDIHVDEGPEAETDSDSDSEPDDWGYGPNGEIVDLR